MHIQNTFKLDTPKLYIIPTPIGNLDDITLRAIKTLNLVDMIFCEDTRVTSKLLNHLNISKPLKTYNDFSGEKEHNYILKELQSGKNIGLVSDAGMPCISDPGYNIIHFLKKNDFDVVILPGPVAFSLPMAFSTNSHKSFTFYGFLNKSSARYKEELQIICSNRDCNSIIYESPHRLIKTLNTIAEINNKTNIMIARELTKLYEEYIEGSVSEIIEHFNNNKPRGEFIIIIEPVIDEERQVNYLQEVQKLVDFGSSKKDAIKEVAFTYNISKNKLYNDYINKDNL